MFSGTEHELPSKPDRHTTPSVVLPLCTDLRTDILTKTAGPLNTLVQIADPSSQLRGQLERLGISIIMDADESICDDLFHFSSDTDIYELHARIAAGSHTSNKGEITSLTLPFIREALPHGRRGLTREIFSNRRALTAFYASETDLALLDKSLALVVLEEAVHAAQLHLQPGNKAEFASRSMQEVLTRLFLTSEEDKYLPPVGINEPLIWQLYTYPADTLSADDWRIQYIRKLLEYDVTYFILEQFATRRPVNSWEIERILAQTGLREIPWMQHREAILGKTTPVMDVFNLENPEVEFEQKRQTLAV